MSTIPYKRIIFLIIALILLVLFTPPVKAEAPMPAYVKPLTPKEAIVKYAQYYTIPAEPLLRVANCESTMNPKALNPKDTDGLPAYGLFQFKDTTFLHYATKAGIESPDIWDAEDQAKTAAYAFSIGKKNMWGCK